MGAIWGSSVMATRFCIQMVNPVTYVGLRFSIAALLYLLVSTLHIAGKKLPTGRQVWKNGALFGIIGDAIPLTLFVLSMQYQSSGLSSILASLFPVMTALFAHFFLPDERLNRRKALGLVSSLSGVCLMALLGETGLPNVQRADLTGYALVLASALISGAFMVYARKHMATLDAWSVTSARFFTAALVVMPLSILVSGFDLSRYTWQGYLVTGYAGVIFFAGFFISFLVLQKFGATTNALADYVTPIMATTGGWLLLGERITPGMLGGIALIALGLVLLNAKSKPAPQPAASPLPEAEESV